MSRPKKAQSQLLLARQIVAHVFENKFEKGHHLVETTLARRFGVSRTLIRASLKHLAKEDMVEPRRNQGFFLLRRWDKINAGAISVPPSVADALYRRIVRDRMSGKIPEKITQVALMERYSADRGALLRALETMANEGIITKNKGHGWTFLPTISNENSVRNSYDFRCILEPSGILLETFRVDPVALERLRAAHLALQADANTASGPGTRTSASIRMSVSPLRPSIDCTETSATPASSTTSTVTLDLRPAMYCSANVTA